MQSSISTKKTKCIYKLAARCWHKTKAIILKNHRFQGQPSFKSVHKRHKNVSIKPEPYQLKVNQKTCMSWKTG